MGENGGIISRAMETAEYAPSIIHATEKLTNSKGWKELIDQHIPDKKLAKVLNEGLESGKRVFKNNNETGEIEDMGIEPDYATRHKYLETGLKLKGHYVGLEENKPKQSNTTYNFIFSEEVQKQIKISNEIIKAKLIENDSTS